MKFINYYEMRFKLSGPNILWSDNSKRFSNCLIVAKLERYLVVLLMQVV